MWSLGKGGRDRSGSHKQRGGTEMFSKMTVTFLTRELYAKRCFPLSHIFWGMTLAEGFPAARGFWEQKKFRHTIRSLCLLQIVVMPVKLNHFYTVYCRCASTSMATHLPCNNLNNSRNTSWGTLEKFRHTECCNIQVRTLSPWASHTAQKQDHRSITTLSRCYTVPQQGSTQNNPEKQIPNTSSQQS